MVLEIKKMSINCPKGQYMITEAAKGPVAVAILLRKNDQTNQILAYVDDDSDVKNICGKVVSVDGDTDLSILNSILGTQYECRVTGLADTANTMTATLTSKTVKKENGTSEASEELEQAFQKAITEGIITEEDKTIIMSIFDDHNIDPILRLRTVQGYKKFDRPVRRPNNLYINPDPSQKISIFSKCLRMAVGRKPVVYKGDKSVGKNVCAETVAYVTQTPYYLVSFNRQMMAEDLYGSRTISNEAASQLNEQDAMDYVVYTTTQSEECKAGAAKFEFMRAKAQVMNIMLEDSEFCAWLEHGGTMMFNEMNMAEANFFSSFANPLADGTGFLFIPGKGRVNINPDCILIGSENENYTGTADQNDATMSRFAGIEFPYPPSILNQLKSVTEENLGSGVLQNKYYSQCDEVYKQWRNAVHQGQLTNACLNIRGFVRALDEVAKSGGYDTLENELDMQIVTMCDPDERVALRARIREKVTI